MTAPSDTPAGNVSTFVAQRWHVEWWVLPKCRSIQGVTTRVELLQSRALPVGSPPITWSYFNWPEATELETFALSSVLREELKSCLRKRSHIRGNARHPFFRVGRATIPFEVYVLPRLDHSFALLFRTLQMSEPVSASDLVRISSFPSTSGTELSNAINKICAVLQAGDANARASKDIRFSWYPYIHISTYTPCLEPNAPADDVPWHELAAIGTRHKQIAATDRPLIESYKAKNHSLRGEVLVVDKQSTLVVSPKEYLELGGVRHCLAVALRMRSIMDQQFRGELESNPLNHEQLSRLRFALECPSVITDSQNYRTLWPLIARECQVLEWLKILEREAGRVKIRNAGVTSEEIAAVAASSEAPSPIADGAPPSPKSIEWLHLSDLHFRVGHHNEKSRARVLAELSSDLKNRIRAGWHPDFVAVTGDIAFSGAAEEYDLAWLYLSEVMGICGLEASSLFLVPGNHDVVRREHMPALLKALREAGTQEEYETVSQQLGTSHIQAIFNRRLSTYLEFAKNLPESRQTSDQQLWYVDAIRGKGGATAAVAGLTSSWAAGEDEEDVRRFLAVGPFQIRPAMNALRKADADIRIVMLHHPLDALQVQDERAMKIALRNSCNVLLRGHLHSPAIGSTADPDWQYLTLAAGSAYETAWSMNGYLLARATIAPSKIKLDVCARRWSPQGEFFGADTTTYRAGRDQGVFEMTVGT